MLYRAPSARYRGVDFDDSAENDNAPVALVRVVGHIIAAARVDRARGDKVLVQVIDEFENVALHSSRYGDIVDQAELPIQATTATERLRN